MYEFIHIKSYTLICIQKTNFTEFYINKLMCTNRRADILVKFISFHVSSRFGPPPTLATLPW